MLLSAWDRFIIRGQAPVLHLSPLVDRDLEADDCLFGING